jgi:hypothetical protein
MSIRWPRPSFRSHRSALALVAALAVVGLAQACGDDPAPRRDAGAARPLRLEAIGEQVVIAPGGSRDLVFRLLDDRDAPVPERAVVFTIVDDPAIPGDDAKGATLSSDRGTTTAQGTVRLSVFAGLDSTLFHVRATSPGARSAEAVVIVGNGTHASVEVVPVIEGLASEAITTVRLHRYDGEPCSKYAAQLTAPPAPAKNKGEIRTVPAETPVLLPTLSRANSHALLAIGLDATESVRVGGCLDLPGETLLFQEVMRVLLPLRPLLPSATGEYRATSLLQIRPLPRGAVQVGDAWQELTECPLDPARLWLDCTVDALSTGPADPLDCRPGEDEGPLGARLQALRGPLTPGTNRCRDRESAGREALDAQVAALFPSPRPTLLAELAAIGAEAGQLLTTVRLASTLRIALAPLADAYLMEHGLESAAFALGDASITVRFAELGLAPVLRATSIPVQSRPGGLEIARHGFAARLGISARVAFVRGSLLRRGAPPETGAFASHLVGFATRGTLSGCAALDDALCSLVDAPGGCLAQACEAGLTGLTQKLEAGFATLDGEAMDLILEGTAPVVDRTGDRNADALGWVRPGISAPGLWTGELRTRAGASPLSGFWTADRTRP